MLFLARKMINSESAQVVKFVNDKSVGRYFVFGCDAAISCISFLTVEIRY